MPPTVKSQTGRRALFLGVGYTARAIILQLKARNYRIFGTARTAEKAQMLAQKLDIEMCVFSGEAGPALKEAMSAADILISSIPPSDDGRDPVITAFGSDLSSLCPKLKWAGYLSATSVYGDRQGGWAFEEELLRPKTQRGRNRVEAELAWMESGLPVHIFRLAGIYGPDLFGQSRNPFARLRSGKARAVIKVGHVVNRIHVYDIATAVMASIDRPHPLTVYNISDGHPAPPQNVLAFAAKISGQEPPPQVDFETADMSDMARSFYLEAKRVDNSKARQELGWAPEFASYEEGLEAIFNAQEIPESLPVVIANVTGQGTKHLRAGAKVYVIDGFFGTCDKVHVVGQYRKGGRIFKIIMAAKNLEKFRAGFCYSPRIIEMMKTHYKGHKLPDTKRVDELAVTFKNWADAD